MINIQQESFELVVSEAMKKAGDSKRWQNAIERAADEILSNPYIHLDGDVLIMLSSSSLLVYEVNGTCHRVDGSFCPAFEMRRPCKHRATKQLLQRYNEFSAQRYAPHAPREVMGGMASRVERPRVFTDIKVKFINGRRIEKCKGIQI